MQIDHLTPRGRIVGTIATGNAAFAADLPGHYTVPDGIDPADVRDLLDDEARGREVDRLVTVAAGKVADGAESGRFIDYNGNKVGSWELVE